jgi:hypothetical protein
VAVLQLVRSTRILSLHLLLVLNLCSQSSSGFHRGLGRGQCSLGCQRRLSGGRLSSLETRLAHLRGGIVAARARGLGGICSRRALELEVDMATAAAAAAGEKH